MPAYINTYMYIYIYEKKEGRQYKKQIGMFQFLDSYVRNFILYFKIFWELKFHFY